MIRIFDILFSGLAIVALLPFLIPVIVLLRLTGEHDVIYRQVRIGRHGERFYVYKFATMLRDSPNLNGGLITRNDDPRILPLGRFLRKTKINEIPQLVNVFLGDMSLIGYRPFAEPHYRLYSEEVKKSISTVRPGLSGIGSIIFKNEEEILHKAENGDWLHDVIITPYKGKLETWYVEHRNLSTYFLLIIITIWAFIRPRSKAVWWVFKGLPPIPSELKDYI